MADPEEEHATRAMGKAATRSVEAGLQRAEVVVLRTLRDRIQPPAAALSGHALREELQRQGLAKLDVTLATQSLVGYGLIARVRRDDTDGRFYTAYQLTARGAAWLRANAEAGRGAGSD